MKLRKYRVLFVCIGNACRSPMAESIAGKVAADVMEASSAGIAPLGRIAENTREVLEAHGYDGESLESKAIRRETWDAADIVINMTGTERRSAFFDNNRVEDWPIADPYGSGMPEFERTLAELENRVKELADWLRKKRTAEMNPTRAKQ